VRVCGPRVARDTLEWPKTTVRWDVDYAKQQRLQRFSRVERETGLEPALSGWEPTRYGEFTVAGRLIVRGADTA